ncbi:MAG: helix-turn-helix domain-containing protein [Candidatus Sulfobium sp.]|jgi:hypothetical protein
MRAGISEIIDRMKEGFGYHTDTKVASALGISKANLSNYKKSGTIPYEALSRFSEQTNCSLDWLLFGIGSRLRGGSGASGLQESVSLTPRARNLLKKVVASVEKYLNSENLDLNPDKKAELIAILYEDLLKDESKEAEMDKTIARLAGLAA